MTSPVSFIAKYDTYLASHQQYCCALAIRNPKSSEGMV